MCSGIPNLLPPSKNGKDDTFESIGDGFGSFRPSTSFNDLSSLLTSTLEAEKAKPLAAVAASGRKKPTKKRAASSHASPSPKRNDSAAQRKSTKGKISSAVKSVGTPNPLPVQSEDVLTKLSSPMAPAFASGGPLSGEVPSDDEDSTIVMKGEEEDFKAIAQAAVSNLMTKACVDKSAGTKTSLSTMKIDTSTEHIKALTGNNWVAACSGGATGVSENPDNKSNNRSRRQNLTADERARQNRDRNREHARNTRLRKKAYVEELKRALTELVAQRDSSQLEKHQSAQRELEQREVRFRVIEEFLKLRGRNESNFARWAAILEDGFSLTLPLADLSQTIRSDLDTGLEHTLTGVSDVMADTNVFSTFLQTIGSGEGTVRFQFHCDRKSFFMDGCQAILEWSATTTGAISKVCECVYTEVSI